MEKEEYDRISVPLIAHELDPSDPTNREQRAMLEFLRALSIGKLIAVVGSGATATYGYRDWEQFSIELCNCFVKWANQELSEEGVARSAYGAKNRSGSTKRMKHSGVQLCKQILDPGMNEKDAGNRLSREERLSICGAIIEECLTQHGKDELHNEMKKWFGPQKVHRWQDFDKEDKTANLLKEKISDALSIKISENNDQHYLPPDLSKLLELFPVYKKIFKAEVIDDCDAQVVTSLSEGRGKYPVTPDEKINAHRNVCDPLATLRSALSVHRYATFNYDLEIERLLEDLDYPFNTLTDLKQDSAYRISESRIGGVAKSISLSAANAAELIALAAIPSSANDMVVHMHGAVIDKKKVITPSDYNELYVDPHSNMLAFEDARSLLFGGNAVVHVGFGLSEEDLLRPLRYLKSKRRNRPLFALMPMLFTEQKAQALAYKVKASYGVNVITYGLSFKSIKALRCINTQVRHPLQDVDEDFISLADELNNIESMFCKDSGALHIGKSSSIPRISSHPSIVAVLRRLEEIDRNDLDFSLAPKFFDFLKSIAISTALDQALIYFKANTAIWQSEFSPGEPSGPNTIAADYGCARTSKAYRNNKAIFKQDKNAVKDAIREQLKIDSIGDLKRNGEKKVAIYQFDCGYGRGTFISHLRDIVKNRYKKQIKPSNEAAQSTESKAVRFISINHTMRAKSIMTDVLENIKSTKFLCIINPEQLLENKAGQPSSVFFMDFLIKITSRDDESPDYVVFVTRSQEAERKLMKLAGQRAALENKNSYRIHSQPLSEVEFTSGLSLEKKNDAIAFNTLLKKSRWSNIVLIAVKKQFEAERKERGDPFWNWPTFYSRCVAAYNSKSFGVDTRYLQSIFCGTILEQRQRTVQAALNQSFRKKIVLENIILKWMFSIYIPIDRLTIQNIPEINDLVFDPDGNKIYSFSHSDLWGALESLQELGFVYELDIAHESGEANLDQKRRYVLHSAVRQYLAHKRGLSTIGGLGRDSQSVTLAMALLGHGQALNEEDYRETRRLVDAFLRGQSAPGGENENHSSSPRKIRSYKASDRIMLRSAYAVMKGGLNTQNVMRAGLANASVESRRSVLSDHLGRLGRLRSAALAKENPDQKSSQLYCADIENGRTSPHSASVNVQSIAPTRSPVIYWHDRIWLLNEMGVVRFLQGNFHDAMLIFRQVIQSVEKGDEHDATLEPRVLVNISLCLVERARFYDAATSIDLALKKLDELRSGKCAVHTNNESKRSKKRIIFSVEKNPEFMLLYAMVLGCRAEIQLLSAELEFAANSIKEALNYLPEVDTSGVCGWLHHIKSKITLAAGDFDKSKKHSVLALAAARRAQRPDLILSFEITEIEFELRNAGFARESVLASLSRLEDIQATVARLGSYKLEVGILLLRARMLLTLEQVESARSAVIEAISLAQLNGMRLRRISGLILLVALMALRGEKEAARNLCKAVKFAATRARYVRAVVEIEGLEQSMDVEGGIPAWAGYVSEFSRSSQSHLPRK